MHTKPWDATRIVLTVVAGLALITVGACGEYTVPITDQPTRKVDRQLIGDWVTPDEGDIIKVRQLTDSSFSVYYNGLLFRAVHSDLAGIPFLSVQELETDNRTYSYVAYRLSPDGSKLFLRMVNEEVIPDDSNQSEAIRTLLLRNLQNQSLFHPEDGFIRQP